MLMERYCASERKACALVGLSRTAWRYMPLARDNEAPFRAEVIRLPLRKWIILSNQAEPLVPPNEVFHQSLKRVALRTLTRGNQCAHIYN